MTNAVTATRDVLAVANLSEPVAGHRTDYWTWVSGHAEPFMRRPLLDLRDEWRHNNGEFFGGRMLEPYITLTEPSAPQLFGQCCSVSSWGSRLEIRLRPSLLDGTHPRMSGEPCHAAGRLQFVKDVLLHEMVHQHVMEHQPDVNEDSYHGHGPVFTEHANRIGAVLGFDEVVVRNRGGEKKPSSSTWPHCAVPAERYGGAYQANPRPVTTKRDTAAPDEKISTWCGGRSHEFDGWAHVYDALAVNVGALGTVIGTLDSPAYRAGRSVKIPLVESEDMTAQLKDLHAALWALLDNSGGFR